MHIVFARAAVVVKNIGALAGRFDVWFLVLLGLLSRLYGAAHMDYANFPEFYRDYGMTSRALAGEAVWLGPPSMLGGFHFPSFYYYLMTPFLWLFHGHPFGLIVAGAVFGALTVFGFYAVLLRWTGSVSVARLGALLCALSAYGVHLASYTSNPNFLPAFVVGFLYYLTKVLEKDARLRDYVFLGLCFAAATELHTTALIVLPLVSMAAMLTLKFIPPLTKLCVSAGVATACYVPYVYYDGLHGFQNLKRLFLLGQQNLQGGSAAFSARALWNFFAGTLTPFNYWYGYTNIEPNWLYAVVALVFVPVLGAVLWRVRAGALRSTPRLQPFMTRAARVLAWSWFCVAALVLLLYSRAAHDHYLIVLWPLPLVLLAWFVWFVRWRFGVWRSLVVALVVVSLLQLVSFHQRASEPWSDFFAAYNAGYRNNQNINEIGAVW